uniref:RING-type domain-containing protein n=1 Tax=Macrostomum lignano TaxID=282301 RepID=A0A1I8F4P2_9PLAT
GNAKVDPLSSGPVANDATDCPVCGKPVPPGNAELHRVACDRGNAKIDSCERPLMALRLRLNPLELWAARRAAKKRLEKPSTNNTEEDFDALLAEFAAMDSVCGYPDCKTPVRTVGHGCAHCRRRYCLAISYRKFTAAVRLPERQPGESLPVRPLPVLWRRQNPTGRLCDGPSCIAGWRRGWTTWRAVKAAGVCCLCGGQHRSTRGRVFRKQPLNSKKAAAPQGRKTMTAADVELALVEAEFEAFLPAVRECLERLRTRGRGAADEADAEDAELEQDPLADFETLNTNNNNVSNDANSGPTATLDDLDDIMNAVVSGTDDKEGDTSQASPGRAGDDTCSTVQQPRRSYVDALVQFHAPSSSCDEDKAGSKDADDTPVAAEVSDNSKPWSVPNNVVSFEADTIEFL